MRNIQQMVSRASQARTRNISLACCQVPSTTMSRYAGLLGSSGRSSASVDSAWSPPLWIAPALAEHCCMLPPCPLQPPLPCRSGSSVHGPQLCPCHLTSGEPAAPLSAHCSSTATAWTAASCFCLNGGSRPVRERAARQRRCSGVRATSLTSAAPPPGKSTYTGAPASDAASSAASNAGCIPTCVTPCRNSGKRFCVRPSATLVSK